MKKFILLTLITLFVFDVNSQRRRSSQTSNTQPKESKLSLSALKLRNVGPAFLSGRIAPNLHGSPSTTKKGLI